MKIFPSGFARRFCRIVALLIFVGSPLALRAQLVADGQTAVLDGVTTSIADDVTIGTNGSFTMLVVTNQSAITNSGMVSIGLNPGAMHNQLVVAGASTWTNGGISLNVGNSGSFNELDVVGGSTVTSGYGYLGYNNFSSNNTVLVSDPGSQWQSVNIYLGQGAGANNLLIVSNGAKVVSSSGVLGTGFGRRNTAIITGAGSVWTNSNGLSVGAYGSNSLFMVTNGGAALSLAPSGLGMLGASSVSNLAIVTDSGSVWSGGIFYVGENSSGNQLKILNGGKVATLAAHIGENIGLSNNLAIVDGSGSLWTNGGPFLIGNAGGRSTLIVTNGGRINNGLTTALANVANGAASSNNTVIITGAGSAFNCGVFNLGFVGPGGNLVRIEQGGALTVGVGAFALGPRCNSNLLVLTDTNSVLQCNGIHFGNQSTNNICVVSNGATMAVVGNQGNVINGTFTRMTATGGGTLCSIAGDLQFGQDSNVLAVLNGAMLVNSNGYIETGSGVPDGKPNTVVVAGAGSVWKNLADLHMMVENNAQLLITNGGVVADSNAYIDDFASSTYTISPGLNCYVLVSGPGSLWTNSANVYIGNKGANNLVVVSDSGTVAATNLYLGVALDGNQMVVTNSGTVLVGNQLQIGTSNSKSNNLVIAGGTVAVTNTLSLNNFAAITLNSGVLRAGFLSILGTTNQFNFNGGLLQLVGSHRFDSSPFIVGDGTDAATFEMLVNGAHILPGGLVVASNGWLKGLGTITGNVSVNNGGTIAPGDTTTGAIAVHGNVVLNAGSTTLMKLNSISSDSLSGITNLTFGGTLQLSNIAGTFAAGNSFKLFVAMNYFGGFDHLAPATPGAGLRWDTNELNIDGVLRVVSITPSAPALATAIVAGGNLALNATGGIPYDPCYLMTCTNFPPAPADWQVVATNYFDATGGTSFTNAIPAGEPQRYFKLQVN